MVDFTLIQANPIPLAIAELQTVNKSLNSQNNALTIVLIGVAVGGILLVAYNEYERKKAENERRIKRQLSRD